MKQKEELFIYSAEQGDTKSVKKLISEGIDPNIQGGEALHQSAANGHVEVMEYLIDSGSSIDLFNQWDYSAFHSAAVANQIKSMEFLLSKGASSEGALIDAIVANAEHSVFYLLKNITFEQKTINTALHWAIEKNSLEIVKELVKLGVPLTKSHLETAEKNRVIDVQKFFYSFLKDNPQINYPEKDC